MREIKIGTTYRHFKGNIYKVIDIVYNAESDNDNLKKVVIYEDIVKRLKWARDYEEFASLVDTKKHPNATQKYRFEEV